MRAQFIDSDYIFKYTIIENNVDADLVTKFIWKAQDLNIQSCLGQNLYTKLKTDCPNFTGDYLTLMTDFIQPALAEWVVYHIMPFINFKLTNKAVSQKSSTNSQPAETSDIIWFRQQVRENAEFYTERIKDYIKTYPTKYPEYFVFKSVFEVHPSRSNYFGGVYTSKVRKGPNGQNPNNTDPCWNCL